MGPQDVQASSSPDVLFSVSVDAEIPWLPEVLPAFSLLRLFSLLSVLLFVSAAEVFFLLPDVPLLFDPLPVGFLLRSLSATENEFDRKL